MALIDPMAELDLYNFSSWKEVEIILEPSGKAPAKYGPGVFRFGASMTLSVLMPRRGWELIKQTDNYAYLRPPGPPPFILKIKIPNKEQAIELANTFFEEAESLHFQIGEWPGTYLHKEPGNRHIMVPAQDGQPIKHIPTSIPRSWFTMGQFGVWSIDLKKFDGEFDYHESVKLNRSGHSMIRNSLFDIPFDILPLIKSDAAPSIPEPASAMIPDLLEGQESSIVQTKYERNPVARKLCIEHFGLACQVCDFDFGRRYGKVGEGFIHVHHIVRVSDQGGEYIVDPIRDLIPLCPNCHAVAHLRNPPYSIDELRNFYNRETR